MSRECPKCYVSGVLREQPVTIETLTIHNVPIVVCPKCGSRLEIPATSIDMIKTHVHSYIESRLPGFVEKFHAASKRVPALCSEAGAEVSRD